MPAQIALQFENARLIRELADSLGFHSPTLENCPSQGERIVDDEAHDFVDYAGLFMLCEPR